MFNSILTYLITNTPFSFPMKISSIPFLFLNALLILSSLFSRVIEMAVISPFLSLFTLSKEKLILFLAKIL